MYQLLAAASSRNAASTLNWETARRHWKSASFSGNMGFSSLSLCLKFRRDQIVMTIIMCASEKSYVPPSFVIIYRMPFIRFSLR
jgi:hypothetical protein